MSRPKTKPQSKAQQRPAAAPADPETQARKALDAGRFREATEAFKALLKTEKRPEWIESLAQAYTGRAGELQAKGMLPEALTIWRNRATACGKSLAEPAYLHCLCLTGAHAEAFELLVAISDPISRQTFEVQLAATALHLPGDALAALPEDSGLRGHHASAVAALAACCAGDASGMDSALAQIPFRSPYRDLRPVLKALDAVNQAPAQALALLARVAADSPFARLADATRLATLPDDAWLPALATLDSAGQQLVLDIKGCPQHVRPVLLELASLGATPSAEKILAIFLRGGRARSPGVEALCRRLLPLVMRQTRDIEEYEDRLPTTVGLQIAALNVDVRDKGMMPTDPWIDYVDFLLDEVKGQDAEFSAALILHRLATNNDQDAQRHQMSPQQALWLEKSLSLDPNNPEGRMRLIRGYLRHEDVKRARQHVETALAATPNDTDALLAAVEIAVASDSHKKALGYAKRLLELDPINPRVRDLLTQAGLAQTRKQIRAKRLDLARKELDLAMPWLVSADSTRTAAVLGALCREGVDGDDLLRVASACDADKPLSNSFFLVLEALRLRMEPGTLLRRAELKLPIKPDAADQAQFVRMLDALDDKEQIIIDKALTHLKKPLTQAADHPLPLDARLTVCEALLRRKAYTALQAHARAGLKDIPRTPIFIYFHAVANCGDEPWTLADRQLDALEVAREQAGKANDLRTAHRLNDLLLRADEFPYNPMDELFGFGSSMGRLDDIGDMGDMGDMGKGDSGSSLKAMLHSIVALGGMEEFFRVLQNSLGDAAFQKIKARAGSNPDRLVDALIEHISNGGMLGDFLPPPNKKKGFF